MSLIKMLTNFSKEMKKWVKEGAEVVTEDQLAERARLCTACEFWDQEAFGGFGKCKKCGCSGMKLYLSTSKCPIDKWDKTL